MFGRARAAKVVELNAEPVVGFLVLLVVFGADLLASELFFESLGFRGRTVLVCATYIKRVQTFHATISRKPQKKDYYDLFAHFFKNKSCNFLLSENVRAQTATNYVA